MNTRRFGDIDPESLIKRLDELARDRVNESQWSQWQAFRQAFFHRLPLDEWAGRPHTDIFGAVYEVWRQLSDYRPDIPAITLFNPDLEEDGWLCPHTVLLVHLRDMPFLVDSIRIELNRRNIAIHSIKSTVLNVRRDDKARVSELHMNGSGKNGTATPGENAGFSSEALIYMEVGLHTGSKVLKQIRRSLASVLDQVRTVVDDFALLRDATGHCCSQLQRVTREPLTHRTQETQAFLEWLLQDHFTFMAYTEYDRVQEADETWLVERPESRLGLFRSKDEADRKPVDDRNPGTAQFHLSPKLIAFSKAPERSRVHRQAYADYIVIKRFDERGELCGESRLLGLYTSSVYTQSPANIPLLREKVNEVFERSGLNAHSHDGKALWQILETFPRDELFQASTSQLFDLATGVAAINERYQVRLFMRPDAFGKFVSALVYVPRELFNTRIRQRIQEMLREALGAREVDFTTYFSESILARVHLVFRVDPSESVEPDVRELESRIIDITRSWEDQLLTALTDAKGEERAAQLLSHYQDAFPSAYREHFDARIAVQDLDSLMGLRNDDDLALSFYQPAENGAQGLRFKVFRRHRPMELSDVIPVLEHLGLRVVAEHPYRIVPKEGLSTFLHNFYLTSNGGSAFDMDTVRELFQNAFASVWHGDAESDSFNRLVLSAKLGWREISILRALAAYMHQTLFNFTGDYIASALVNHSDITRDLVDLFKARFDPSHRSGTARTDTQKRTEQQKKLHERIIKALDNVQNLNEDRIIRRYLAMIEGCVRTNYFQKDAQGQSRSYLSFKLTPRDIPDIPEPRPLYEIFVYSPRMEGVHLRAGKVARGGLRWSDRLQDYRTEVLGLVKAQQVKNAVIVPNGAKGGFVCKKPPQSGDRKARQEEAIACYRLFIRGLLDLTDNLIDGEPVPPKQTVRLDDDDPYLVVAADKGTATFSDIANEISAEYGHWLGDAFASGGSHGYDHKAMGITARGAWVAVQRHFRERGIDVQNENFTAIGIGDMAGDVFGNGMLLSRHIGLVAAFNHLHIFIDPEPDVERSFEERQRLFSAQGSSWQDYDTSLISEGGGVFSRDAKSIAITEPMRQRFDIQAENLTPTELIHALLKAPVDLLWNGGIGTYVKASTESHADVGDKANDTLRVNGDELRCKVVGEGGNLGMTQRGRIEYVLGGGLCNTDFIDNAAGVDCSDHEVNIKILLNELIAKGDLTEKQRNQQLEEMTEEVAELVLDNNYHQTQAISIAASDAMRRNAEYRRVMQAWEAEGRLNRALEFLPDEEILIERQAQGQGLTRPELAVLVSYAKVILKNDLAQTNLADDDYIARFAYQAFPSPLRERYSDAIDQHRLRRELVATQVANDMVNTMGLSFAQRLLDSTGVGAGDVARAYIIARDIYAIESIWEALESLDHQVDAGVQMGLMKTLMRRVRRASRWFLRNRRSHLEPALEIEEFSPLVHTVLEHMPEYLSGAAREDWNEQVAHLKSEGVPDELLYRVATPGHLYSGLSVAEVSRHTELPLLAVMRLYLLVNERLQLHDFARQISDAAVESYWQAMARETYLDDLESQLRSLTLALCSWADSDEDIEQSIDRWTDYFTPQLDRWRSMMNEVQNSSGTDYAIFSVALRELLDLVQMTQHCEVEE
ncbi:NAD-glutamate dehydrogenase [Marinimicrobium sp. ARAG 43.8]|uniref:NAD-glutamate dehydrogenase n=1 Tax=Marinimicrobium sp. ARAG 43.8 TaxID=3418719 RepID=UPI003CEA62A2